VSSFRRPPPRNCQVIRIAAAAAALPLLPDFRLDLKYSAKDIVERTAASQDRAFRITWHFWAAAS